MAVKYSILGHTGSRWRVLVSTVGSRQVPLRWGDPWLSHCQLLSTALLRSVKTLWLYSLLHKVESSWNVMAHGDAREGKWRGNWRMEWVASTLHTTSEHGVSSVTTADAHTSAASSRLKWRPCRFKWTRPFRQKMKYGFCACAITFQTQSTASRRTCAERPSWDVADDSIELQCVEAACRNYAACRYKHLPSLRQPLQLLT
jgi:hypothetical protein